MATLLSFFQNAAKKEQKKRGIKPTNRTPQVQQNRPAQPTPQPQQRPIQQPTLQVAPPKPTVIPIVKTAAPQNLNIGNQVITPIPGIRAVDNSQKLAQVQRQIAQFKAPQAPLSLSNINKAVAQPIARSVPEVAVTAREAITGNRNAYNPGSRIEKAVFGPPVKPVQETVRGTYRAVKAGHQNLPGGIPISSNLAVPYAAANAALHIGQDAPVIGGAAKGLNTVSQATAPIIKAGAGNRTVLNEVGGVGKNVNRGTKVPSTEGKLLPPKTSASSGKQPRLPTPSQTQGVSPQGVAELPKLGKEARLPNLPKPRTPSNLQTRGFFETVFNDSKTPTKTKQALLDLDTSYQTHNMKALQTKAANLVKTDTETAARIANAGEGDMSSMVGSELIKHYGDTGQHELAVDMAKTVATNATQYGQANAALASYAKLKPEGVLRFTQRELNKYNKATGKNLILSTDKAKVITEKSKTIQNMPDGYAKEAATQDLLKEVYTAFPATWSEKVSTLQTMAQLLNPKTLIRNIGGNSIFGGLENVSQTVGTPIDTALSLVTGKRTTGLPSLRTQTKAGIQGFKTGYRESTKGINTGPQTQYDIPRVPVFRGKTLGGAEKGLNVALRGPDRAAYEAAKADSLRAQMKAAGVSQPTTQMVEEAEHTGLYRTFQDDTVSSRFFVGMKKALNTLGVGVKGKRFGLGDLVLKYPKTPGNLLARGLDYSPTGFAKAAFQATKPLVGKEFNQKAFVDAFSRAITGSSVAFGMGYLLSDAGIITAKPNQDKDIRNLQKQSGLGGYQINASAFKRWVLSGFDKGQAGLRKGDRLVSYDWAQPVSIPVSAGAALGAQKPGEAVGNAADTVGNSVNTLVEQPLLQGVQKLFGSNKNTGGITGAATETLKGLPSSFTPTIVSQVNQSIDNTSRNTKSSNPVTESLNQVKAKVPGLAQTLPKNYDVLGKPQERYQGKGNNLFNVFLNPAFMSNYNPDKAAQLPLDIYKNTGETKQAPRTVGNSVQINGKTKQLTGQEMSQYQKYVGEKTAQAYKGLVNNPAFQKLSDTDKANKMSNILTDINAAAKIELFGDKNFGNSGYDPSKLSKGVRAIFEGNVPTYTPTVPKAPKSAVKTASKTVYDPQSNTWTQTTARGKVTKISADGTRTVVQKGLGTISGSNKEWENHIRSFADKHGVDANAALAVAAMEGLGGGVGDNGTSYGPFQLHVGGALPPGKDRAWAESPAGIEYAVKKMSEVAKGKKGQAAIEAIVREFERPADPNSEIAGALAIYSGKSAKLAPGSAKSTYISGSSGRRKGSGRTAKPKQPKLITTGFKTAKASSIKTPKGVKVKKLGSPKLSRKKLPVSKLPKISGTISKRK